MLPEIFCLGAVNLDLVYRVDDLPGFLSAWGPGLTPGEAAVLDPAQEDRLREMLGRYGRPLGRYGGGPAANTAYALARLGLPAALVGRVGADADGDFLADGLTGVNLDFLIQAGESGRAYVLVDPEGQRTTLVAPRTNDALREQDIPWETLKAAKFLHLAFLGGEPSLEVASLLAARLQNGPRITFDPGELCTRGGRAALTPLLDHVETLLVTEKEWGLLGGEMKRHPDWAPPIVVVKRGPEGARMLTPVRYLDFPVESLIPPAGPPGAGDVFAAGYLTGLFIGLNLPQAVRLAVLAAAYKITGPGRERYPDRRVLDTIIARLR